MTMAGDQVIRGVSLTGGSAGAQYRRRNKSELGVTRARAERQR